MTWRWYERVGVAIALLGSILLGIATMLIIQAAPVGAGYIAKNMCSCVFVGGRTVESCRPDMLRVMAGVVIDVIDSPQERSIRATLPPFATRVARFEDHFGCTLE